jgi:hypothetical protein
LVNHDGDEALKASPVPKRASPWPADRVLPGQPACRAPDRPRPSALTAWQGLFERARLAAGQRVLSHGAACSVGSFAIQFARRRGTRVTATAAAGNLDFVRGLGADEVIDPGPSGSRSGCGA